MLAAQNTRWLTANVIRTKIGAAEGEEGGRGGGRDPASLCLLSASFLDSHSPSAAATRSSCPVQGGVMLSILCGLKNKTNTEGPRASSRHHFSSVWEDGEAAEGYTVLVSLFALTCACCKCR